MKKQPFNPTIFYGNDSHVRRYQSKYADIFLPGETVHRCRLWKRNIHGTAVGTTSECSRY